MKVVALSGTIIGNKTKTALKTAVEIIQQDDFATDVTLLDLADYQLEFSDGRHFADYTGDTKEVLELIMAADVLLIGSPVFQASIPGTLKNIFDLLPGDAFRDKVCGLILTAGSAKHYLIAEMQLKPILTYMKARVVPHYVYIEEKDFYRNEIRNDDVRIRIRRLIEETMMLAEVQKQIERKKEEQYGF